MSEILPDNPDDFDPRFRDKADENLLVRFYYEPRPSKTKKHADGRPLIEEVEYISIKIPGDRLGGFSGPATYEYKERFPQHYRAFKQRSEMPLEGTPLSEWPGMTRSQVEEMAYFNVKTIEQLASISDSSAQNFRGIQALKQKAKAYIEAAKEAAPLQKLAEELSKRDETIGVLNQHIEDIERRLAAVEVPAPVVVAQMPTSVPVVALETPVLAPDPNALEFDEVENDVVPIDDEPELDIPTPESENELAAETEEPEPQANDPVGGGREPDPANTDKNKRRRFLGK